MWGPTGQLSRSIALLYAAVSNTSVAMFADDSTVYRSSNLIDEFNVLLEIDIAKCFNDIFVGTIENSEREVTSSDNNPSIQLTSNQILRVL